MAVFVLLPIRCERCHLICSHLCCVKIKCYAHCEAYFESGEIILICLILIISGVPLRPTVIGGWGNQRVIVRRKQGANVLREVSLVDILVPDKWIAFLIQITTRTIAINSIRLWFSRISRWILFYPFHFICVFKFNWIRNLSFTVLHLISVQEAKSEFSEKKTHIRLN